MLELLTMPLRHAGQSLSASLDRVDMSCELTGGTEDCEDDLFVGVAALDISLSLLFSSSSPLPVYSAEGV
jgi:hypothetical protein